MTALAALVRYYDRLANDPASGVAPYGYAPRNIGWCLVLGPDGSIMQAVSLTKTDAKGKERPRQIIVPQSPTRTSGIAANFLWDKSAYALGVAPDNKQRTAAKHAKRTAAEHAAFKAFHRDALAKTEDPGLRALLAFLDLWTPDQFVPPMFPEDMRGGNIVFRFDDELGFLHERPAAKALWTQVDGDSSTTKAICLITGKLAPIERTHPLIKEVKGAKTSGAAIISYNSDAFESYGYEQGDNAPVSKAAAHAYTTVLNRLLAYGSRHCVRVGDVTTVFWAEASEPEQAVLAEACFGMALGLEVDTEIQADKIQPILQAIAKGRPLAELDPDLATGVKFYVLGLAPNDSRLVVRLWLEDSFGVVADRLAEHLRDLTINPPPRDAMPTIRRLLRETVRHATRIQDKDNNVPPALAGQFLRAVLTGGRYPATLLATLLLRLRADGEVTALRVSMLKAIVTRDRRLSRSPNDLLKEDSPPVSYDPDCREPGYLLGQLFAVYEYAQSAALGRKLNVTIKDKLYGSASTTPESVFPLLDRGSVPHLAKLRKEKPGLAVNIEKQIGAIMARLSPTVAAFPKAFSPTQQALFAIGYYHQRSLRFAPRVEAGNEAAPESESTTIPIEEETV